MVLPSLWPLATQSLWPDHLKTGSYAPVGVLRAPPEHTCNGVATSLEHSTCMASNSWQVATASYMPTQLAMQTSLPPSLWASKSLHLLVVKPEITCIVVCNDMIPREWQASIDCPQSLFVCASWDQLTILPTLNIMDEKLISIISAFDHGTWQRFYNIFIGRLKGPSWGISAGRRTLTSW